MRGEKKVEGQTNDGISNDGEETINSSSSLSIDCGGRETNENNLE